MRKVLTIGLWLLVVCAIITSAIPLILFYLFAPSHDSGLSNVTGRAAIFAVPLFVELAILAAAALAIWSWRSPRWRYAAFPIAIALNVFAYVFWFQRIGNI